MRQYKRIKDLYDEHGEWLSVSQVLLIGDWTTYSNVKKLDDRIYEAFSEKVIALHLQDLTLSEITDRVAKYVNSIVYETETLYNTTQQSYNPISNYDMTESGRDETRSSASGDSTSFSTTYDDSETDRKTGKTSTSGSTNEAFIHSLSRSGNIGVTTTQQMLQSEREVAEFDFYGYVAQKIIENFTTSLYFPIYSEMEMIL